MRQNKDFISGSSLTGMITILLFVLTFSLSGYAQMEEMTADDLIREADLLLNSEKGGEAIPFLKDYLKRVEGTEDARILSMAQDVRFKMGTILFQEKNWAEAAAYFEQYTFLRPALQWRDAMKLWSTSLLELPDLEGCAEVTTNALAGPPADVLAEVEAAATLAAQNGEAENPDGLKFDEYGELVQDDDEKIQAEEAHPSGYSAGDLLALNMTLGEVYKDLGQPENTIAPFTYVIEHTDNEAHKGYAIMQVVDGLIKRKDFGKLTEWIPQLYRTDARYDIRVNKALMNAAAALFAEKEYDNALPLYRMVLPREELIAHHTKRMRAIQIEAGIIPADPEMGDIVTKTDETILGKKHFKGVEEFWDEKERTNPDLFKPEALLVVEKLIKTLQALPPYEEEVRYWNAQLYDEVNRPWEAVRFFDRVYQADPESDLGEYAFVEVIRVLLDPLNQAKEALPRAFTYLDSHNENLTPRQIAYCLTAYYQQNEKMPDVKKLHPYLERFVPGSTPAILKYDCELYYMQAVADMVMLEYELAERAFKHVLVRFAGSHQEDNATYWHAITLMFLQKYDEALAEFEAYPKNFPEGNWLPSAAFQSGTCLFGMEKYDEALIRFTTVIENYPDSSVYSDACSLRGDIYGSQGLLDDAVKDYKNAFASARTPKQAKYATFQMATVFESEARYDEIIAAVNNYLTRYGDEADIATGIFWIGKTQMNQGLIDEAVQSYFNAIIQYGTDLKQDGVDSMIGGLVDVAKTRLSTAQRARLETNTGATLTRTENLTLQLRLRAMLAQIAGTEIEFGKQLIAELPDLENASPPVLAAISDASFELKDYSRAKELLEAFTTQFEDSEFMRPAYKLRGFDLFRIGDYDAALKLIDEAQARYGTDYDVAWAQLMKGEILMKQARFDEARKTLTDVLGVTGWRGESYAEATSLLGQTEEAAGNLRKAHAWYQRTYFQYKGYADGAWAAEGYLAAARVLNKLSLANDARNTYRAMLFDKYINHLPQATQAKTALGAEETQEIADAISSGEQMNLTVTIDGEEGEE